MTKNDRGGVKEFLGRRPLSWSLDNKEEPFVGRVGPAQVGVSGQGVEVSEHFVN